MPSFTTSPQAPFKYSAVPLRLQTPEFIPTPVISCTLSLLGLASQILLNLPTVDEKNMCPGFNQAVTSVWSGYAYNVHKAILYSWVPVKLHPELNMLTLWAASCQNKKFLWHAKCVLYASVMQSLELARFLN
jgi:hypothetical protein